MPRYDYRCPECDTCFEKKHSMTAQVITLCPECKKAVLVRQIPLLPVHLKGYGFYKTDSRSVADDYDYDHFDDSGNRSEIKTRDRRIKNPKVPT